MTDDRGVVMSAPDVVEFETTVRRPVSLDMAELPCLDCFIGEPHVCRLIAWDVLRLRRDEFGAWHLV